MSGLKSAFGDGDHKHSHSIAAEIPADLLTAKYLHLQDIINANCRLGTCMEQQRSFIFIIGIIH